MNSKIKKTAMSKNIYLYELIKKRNGKDVLISCFALPKNIKIKDDDLMGTFDKCHGSLFFGVSLSSGIELIKEEVSNSININIKKDVDVIIDKKKMTIPLVNFKKDITMEVEKKVIALLGKTSHGRIDQVLSMDIMKGISICATEDISKKEEVMNTLKKYMGEGTAAKVFLALFGVLGIKSKVEILESVVSAVDLVIRETYISDKELSKASVLEKLC